MSNDEPFVTIRSRSGNFTLNKPNQETTNVFINIPEYDYKEKIMFNSSELHIDPKREPWHDAISEITVCSPKYIGGRDKIEQLEEILYNHHDEIHEQWKQHQKREIEDKIESLKEEKQSL